MSNHLDKPVHKVLDDYDLLEIKVIQNTSTLNMSAGVLWRMNLCAVSNELPCTFFVAMNYKIHVYALDTMNSPFKDPIKTLASLNATRTGGGTESPFIINAIKVGRMLEKEILVSVSEMGEVCIWRTEDLDAPPMILNNNNIATWGIAIHGEQGLLAVSANNFKVTVFNLLEMTRDDPIFGTRKYPNYLESKQRIELEGHEHNIPNIDFNESGRYIASVSVDATCRVWDLVSGKTVTQRKVPVVRGAEQNAWCWSAKFIRPGNFKYSVCIDRETNKNFVQRMYNGRSTSLSNLGLCHSAANPAFPINVSRVFDLEDEDIDFEIYEGEDDREMDDTAWDDQLLEEEDNFMEQVYERQRMEDDHDYNFGGSSEQIAAANTPQRDYPPPATESDWEATINSTAEPGYDGWGDEITSAPEDSANDWQDVSSSNDQSEEGEEGEGGENNTSSTYIAARSTFENQLNEQNPSYCIPNIIKSTSTTSLNQLTATSSLSKEEKEEEHNTLGEYLMIATAKDVALCSTTTPRMNRIRAEHSIIDKVDIRSDQLLSLLDRINMMEWLPELELFVVASQKGTVALTRLLQVEFEGNQQACIFNIEHYLPNNVLQATPLYGMTVKKVTAERYAPISYQIFLFYYSGNVLGYTVSRKDSGIVIDNLIF